MGGAVEVEAVSPFEAKGKFQSSSPPTGSSNQSRWPAAAAGRNAARRPVDELALLERVRGRRVRPRAAVSSRSPRSRGPANRGCQPSSSERIGPRARSVRGGCLTTRPPRGCGRRCASGSHNPPRGRLSFEGRPQLAGGGDGMANPSEETLGDDGRPVVRSPDSRNVRCATHVDRAPDRVEPAARVVSTDHDRRPGPGQEPDCRHRRSRRVGFLTDETSERRTTPRRSGSTLVDGCINRGEGEDCGVHQCDSDEVIRRLAGGRAAGKDESGRAIQGTSRSRRPGRCGPGRPVWRTRAGIRTR